MLKTQSVRRVRSSNEPPRPAELPEPPRPEDVGAALRALGAALRDYIRLHSRGSGHRGLWPRIDRGHPVHAAVCAVQTFYGGMLPLEGWERWRRLAILSREPSGDLSSDTGFAASALCHWVDDELGRAAPSRVEPSGGAAPPLEPNESLVLAELQKTPGVRRLRKDIASALELDEKTVGVALAGLVKCGRVIPPEEGKRNGFAVPLG